MLQEFYLSHFQNKKDSIFSRLHSFVYDIKPHCVRSDMLYKSLLNYDSHKCSYKNWNKEAFQVRNHGWILCNFNYIFIHVLSVHLNFGCKVLRTYIKSKMNINKKFWEDVSQILSFKCLLLDWKVSHICELKSWNYSCIELSEQNFNNSWK
jgi:hypothetical protein